MPRPSLTDDEKKERKRLCEQKRKIKIKSDPVLREEFLKKDRERYARRKSAGLIISRKDLTPRRLRTLRKKNLTSALAYYKRKKAKVSTVNLIDNLESAYIPTAVSNVTEVPESPEAIEEETFSPRSRRVSSVRSLRINTLVENNLKFVTSSPQQTPPGSPQPALNLSSIQSPESTIRPNSPASESSVATVTFKRELINRFRKYQKCKNYHINMLRNQITTVTKERDVYKKRLQRLIQKVKKIFLRKQIQKLHLRHKSILNKNRNIVVKFFEDDENSSLCPGKNDTVTRNGLKKQKRLMTDTIRNLHKKNLNSGYPPISYVTFSRMRPFWVQQPNINMRNTCLCEKHENMDLLISSLKTNRIIRENTTTTVLKSICCDIYNLQCLLRICSICKDKHLSYQEFNNSEYVYYWTWEKQKNTYNKSGVVKTAYNVDKIRHRVKPLELINIFESKLYPFLKHCAYIRNQSDAIKTLKQNITENDCLVHVDFSENYGAKYNSEIQSLHFGGSRKQFTLHTSVLYFNIGNKTTKTQCYCTLSACERHDAAAVWAHFVPILRKIKETVPLVKNLYIVSDSPTAQYRNKKIFFLITQLASYIPTLKVVVWNYCECGHGKGAPDGVGGLLKRTADKFVSHNKGDIIDINSLITSLKSSVQNVILEKVEDYEVIEKDWLLPNNLKAFRGTMQVHQVVWTKQSGNHIALRRLSCTESICLNSVNECPHGKHLGIYYIPKTDQDKTLTRAMPQILSNTAILPKQSKSYKNVLTSLRPVKLTDKLSLLPKPSTSTSKQNSSADQHSTYSFLDKNLPSNYVDTNSDNSIIPSCSFLEKIDSPMLIDLENCVSKKQNRTKPKSRVIVSSSDSDESIMDYKSKRKLIFFAQSDSDEEIFSYKPLRKESLNVKQSDSDD